MLTKLLLPAEGGTHRWWPDEFKRRRLGGFVSSGAAHHLASSPQNVPRMTAAERDALLRQQGTDLQDQMVALSRIANRTPGPPAAEAMARMVTVQHALIAVIRERAAIASAVAAERRQGTALCASIAPSTIEPAPIPRRK
jgi:hypothetical protein